ncbi:hypothetical protein NFI96_033556 [Prochilodus magdalenae]|nr:hypothetical protein NFI96_033556 [Prochilodus magdalenae]
MALAMALLLSAAFFILAPGIFPKGEATTLYPLTMTVYDTVTNKPNKTYSTEVAYRGILIGAMQRAKKKYNNFRFTTTYNLDYGPFLESVNGLKGNTTQHTYWQLLIQPKNGMVIVADVGIGCYIPDPDDHIIFKFTKW